MIVLCILGAMAIVFAILSLLCCCKIAAEADKSIQAIHKTEISIRNRG